MTRGKGPFSLANPWPRAAWGTLALILGISLVLGFIVLSRYQQNGEPLGVWALARFCLCTASLNRRSCFRPLCLCPGNPVSPQRRLWFEKTRFESVIMSWKAEHLVLAGRFHRARLHRSGWHVESAHGFDEVKVCHFILR